MTIEIADALLWSSVTLSLALIAVLIVRKPVRRLLGARTAYGLWLIVPLTCLVWFLPAPPKELGASVTQSGGVTDMTAHVSHVPLAIDWALVAVTIWLAGAMAAAYLFWHRQKKFRRSLGKLTPCPGLGPDIWTSPHVHGPLVIGAWNSRIVIPSDFHSRFEPHEQSLMLDHERGHVRRNDPAVALIGAMLRALFWFNPLVHFSAGRLAEDQELACDATVISAHMQSARSYASLIVSVNGATALPAGALAISSSNLDFLRERLVMLKPRNAGRGAKSVGKALFTCAIAGAALALTLVRPASATWMESETTGIDDRNAKLEEALGSEKYRAYVEKMTAACEAAKSDFAVNTLTDGLTAAQLAMLVCIGLPE